MIAKLADDIGRCLVIGAAGSIAGETWAALVVGLLLMTFRRYRIGRP